MDGEAETAHEIAVCYAQICFPLGMVVYRRGRGLKERMVVAAVDARDAVVAGRETGVLGSAGTGS